jgi:hypothetical protein
MESVLKAAQQSAMALQPALACRIVVTNGPRLFRQLVWRALGTIPDFQVMNVMLEPVALTRLIERVKPDWLITSLRPDGRLPDMIESHLARYPSLNLLGVALDGSRISIRCGKWREEETLTDITFEDLIHILRTGSGTCKPQRSPQP